MATLEDLEIKIEIAPGTTQKMEELSESLSSLKDACDEFGKAFSAKLDAETFSPKGGDVKGHWLGTGIDDILRFDWRKAAMDIHLLFDGEYTMAKKMSKTSPFKKGRAVGRKSGGGSQFIGLKDGESVTFAPLVGLDEMVHADMHEYWDIRPAIFHPCIGKDCPGEAAGNEPRFKGYLPVMKKDGEVLVFPFTISVYNQLEELEDEIDGTLQGYVIKFSRRGSGFSTKYSVLGVGKRIEVDGVEAPDFISQLGPQTREEILALLEANDVELVGPDKKASAKPKEATADKLSDTDEDDDWDEV